MGRPATIQASCASVEDLPRFLRTAAVATPPGHTASLLGIDPKHLLIMARRIEATAPQVVTEERLIVVTEREPLTPREALVFAFVLAFSMWWPGAIINLVGVFR